MSWRFILISYNHASSSSPSLLSILTTKTLAGSPLPRKQFFKKTVLGNDVEYLTKGASLSMQLWQLCNYVSYCTNVDISFDEICIWGCRQLRTSLSVTKILDLQGYPHLRWCCGPRSNGLFATFVGQSTEQSATSTFALDEGNSLHSSSLTRSEHVCIHTSFSSRVLWTTFEYRGLVPLPDDSVANAGTLFSKL